MEYVQTTLFCQQPLQRCLVLLQQCLVFGVWTIFCLDQLLTYLVLAAGAVSTEVLYLAYSGDASITWSDAYSSFGSFCHKATSSVIITFFVVCFYIVPSIISSYKLFTRFDPLSVVDFDKNLKSPSSEVDP